MNGEMYGWALSLYFEIVGFECGHSAIGEVPEATRFESVADFLEHKNSFKTGGKEIIMRI